MTRETYRGVKLSAQSLRGRSYGLVREKVSGVLFGDWREKSEASALESLRRTVDEAFIRPEAYPGYWRGES